MDYGLIVWLSALIIRMDNIPTLGGNCQIVAIGRRSDGG